MTSYGEQNFDVEKWSHLHSFSVEKYQNMADLDKLAETDLVPFRYFVVKKVINLREFSIFYRKLTKLSDNIWNNYNNNTAVAMLMNLMLKSGAFLSTKSLIT